MATNPTFVASTASASVSPQLSASIQEVRRGRPVVLVGTGPDSDGGELVFAAALATRELLNFVVRATSGLVGVALPDQECDRLRLPEMPATSGATSRRYTVTVDAAQGISTGISARDRAQTINLLAAPGSRPHDLTRPGHVLVLRTRDAGVQEELATPEAAVDLVRLAGAGAAAGMATVVSEEDDRLLAGRRELVRFARAHGLGVVGVAEIAAALAGRTVGVEHDTDAVRVRTASGYVRTRTYRTPSDRAEYLAVCQDGPLDVAAPVHVMQECVTGGLFGAATCGCSQQLHEVMTTVAEGRGVLIYRRAAPSAVAACPVGSARRSGAIRGEVVAAILADLRSSHPSPSGRLPHALSA